MATNDFEKFTAAHYVARQQGSIEEKLAWDQTALQHALQIENEDIKVRLPALYLNIAKCYEDLKDRKNAKANYELAFLFINFLLVDGYGSMIKAGVINGLTRLK